MTIAERPNTGFPLSVFPSDVQTVISETATTSGCPPEYLAGAMLTATATAMGNAWSVEVREGWREKALIYMAIVGNAGANKTHPITFALQPLVAEDLRKIDNALLSDPYTAPPRYVASDVTQEGLVKLHQKNPRGMLLFVDELKAWVANFSRYSGGSQEQFWLSNFSRTPIIVDRKSDPKPLAIAEPLISVIGSAQPRVLRQFATGDKSTNGFVDRLLFVLKKGSDKPYWNDFEPSSNHANTWDYVLRTILLWQGEMSCHFSEEAKAVATEWQRLNADIVNGCANDSLVGAHSKLEIYFVRFCLILHALRNATQTLADPAEICAETVENAVLLTEYFRAQRIECEELLHPDEEAELSEKPKMLLRALPASFTRAEAVKIAKALGISKSVAYKALKEFQGIYIDLAEDGTLYKYECM